MGAESIEKKRRRGKTRRQRKALRQSWRATWQWLTDHDVHVMRALDTMANMRRPSPRFVRCVRRVDELCERYGVAK